MKLIQTFMEDIILLLFDIFLHQCLTDNKSQVSTKEKDLFFSKTFVKK